VKITYGTNNSSAGTLYKERLAYWRNYPAGIRNYRYIDYWYNQMAYGRIDHDREIVYPSEAFLKQLPSSGEGSYFVLNFVADAYEAFMEDMRTQASVNHLVNIAGSPFETMFNPTSGWQSANVSYPSYAQHYYNAFLLPFVSTPDRQEEIMNFDDFIEAFSQMISLTAPTTPLTKTEYLGSKYATPLVSGLIIEFAQKSHGDDPTKVTEFVNNINFELYREVASRYGFSVDMNAPWRMTAVLQSPPMQGFMSTYDVTLDTLFHKYYYKASYLDIPTLKVYLYEFYQHFINAFPNISKPVVHEQKGANITLTSVERRAILTPEEYAAKYDNLFWVRFYLYVRGKETNQDWDQHKFDHLAQRASDFLLHSGQDTALKFINKEVKSPLNAYAMGLAEAPGTFRLKRKRA